MTTNASKYGLRAAAKERSNKHAQRTPLPPRPGQVEAAKEAHELLPDLVNVVGYRTAAEEKAASSNAPTTEGRSLGKAKAFAEKACTAGWAVAYEEQGDDAVELTATRGIETIIQSWSGGVWSYPTSFYAHGERNTKPRNASGAAKLLLRSESDAAADASKVASNKHFRKAEPKDIEVRLEEAQRRLPFELEDADEIITGILAGQALSWWNSLSRGTESAMVSRKGARITRTPEGKRIVTFCCPVTGYRSCYVEAILKVGKGRSLVTAGSDTNSAAVEVA